MTPAVQVTSLSDPEDILKYYKKNDSLKEFLTDKLKYRPYQ